MELPSSAQLWFRILRDGNARLKLGSSGATALAQLYREAGDFFALDEAAKRRHSSKDGNFGYRVSGQEYSITPYRPDLNESFTCWGTKAQSIPDHADIRPFLGALEAYRVVLAQLVHGLVEQMRVHYDYQAELPVVDASYIQINRYAVPSTRDLLQDQHEDGHLLTVITANAEGLEQIVGDTAQPVVFSPGEVLVMPASVMTDMTGGAVPAFHHQVRNHNRLDRISIMYFVNPEIIRPIEPFVRNDYNRDMDIRQRVITNPQAFGLPDVPVLT